MAKYYVTRGAGGFNSALPFTFTLSPLVLARAMTRALVDLAAAERELGDETGFDPALSAYRAAVDEARTRVLEHCEALIAHAPATLQAASLQRVAVLVKTVIRSGDPVEVARIRGGLIVARWVWQLPTTVPGHAIYNAAFDGALDALGAYIDDPEGPQDTPPAAGPQMVMGAGPGEEKEAHPHPSAHTEVSRAFTGALRCLDACVAAERRIQRDVVADVFAPEVATDLAAAEAAREDLFARLAEVTALPEQRDLDRPLRLLAQGLHALLSVEDDDDRQHMHAVMAGSADLLLVRGDAPAVRWVRAAQRRFLDGVARLMSMEDFGGRGAGPDDDGTDDAPGLAA
ncbi:MULTISPECIES: hypothetical protein [Marivita]|uniref:Uncharacterized protein n=1 Tax=Marivita cryptomonadis TaxID=505252 RepID=A0A9Q2S457_9RHOB|nr:MULTISPECIES: hypothetical protein [Marivita]MCR9168619.1 hypothetical protein [Paracoccaceae bacterium]MBM2320824.1 hypothetical protein [Marivita cryptomonadis]MBM2330404.1 hypothetical protein [Marivita cryptomonadis]MBM2339991.1 hypothetical protein [Marivita cryptomonadis]MBM2344651.1 hypothetical protein [Marivita cryptomonadis]